MTCMGPGGYQDINLSNNEERASVSLKGRLLLEEGLHNYIPLTQGFGAYTRGRGDYADYRIQGLQLQPN